MNAVAVIRISEQVLQLEWNSSASNDMIADSALALLSGMDTNYATIKRESLSYVVVTQSKSLLVLI